VQLKEEAGEVFPAGQSTQSVDPRLVFEYFPDVQGVHAVSPPIDTCPDGQRSHKDDVEDDVVPSGQVIQDVEPTAEDEYFPGLQLVQLCWLLSEYFPPSHSVQLCVGFVEYSPGLHGIHVLEPRGDEERVPGEQGVQEDAPVPEYVPEGQRVQEEEGEVEYFPGTHCVFVPALHSCPGSHGMHAVLAFWAYVPLAHWTQLVCPDALTWFSGHATGVLEGLGQW